MPQAVGLFPATPPQTSRVNTPPSSNDSGSSKFDDVLDTARNTDPSAGDDSQNSPAATSSADSGSSTDSGKASHAAPSADKSSKPQKSKTQKSTRGKVKSAQSRSAKTSGAETVDSDVDAEKAEQSAIAVQESDAGQSTTQKPRDAAPAAHSAGTAPLPQPLAAGQGALPVQPSPVKDTGSQDGSDDAGGQPSKGLAVVKAIQEQNGDGADPDSDDNAAPAAVAGAETNGKSAAQVGSTKLGAKQAKAAKGSAPNESDDADAPAANAVVSTAEQADDSVAPAENSAHGADSAGTAGNLPPHATVQTFAETLASAQGQTPASTKNEPAAIHAAAPATPVPPEAQFAEANSAQIVSGIHAQLLPNGGSMQMHLNPGELGSMSVSVHMRDGIMTATFETSNDQAAKLLSHSLGQLKTALESQGVSVGRLHVQQSPRNSESGSGGGGKEGGSGTGDKSSQQQEQQRREMLRKMWRRLNGGKDPLDMVA